MMLTFKNSFHGTETTADSRETGLTKYDDLYAEFTIDQIHKISMTLCGTRDCTCHKYESRCFDEDGNSYMVIATIKPPAAVMGAIKSEKKSKSSAENGKKGGRPRKPTSIPQ